MEKKPCYDWFMSPDKERILVVESNPVVSDLIARQTLQPLGYRVEIVRVAAEAIQEAVRFSPDVIIANLSLPGLSGKDLLVALVSQGVEVPIIVITDKGSESDLLQAFRLGAADYLSWPFREAEVVATLERVLKQVRSRREREQLARQLHQTNQELQHRVRELTTIYSIGKAVTSTTDQQALFEQIVNGAVSITEADHGWLLLRQENNKAFLLSAQRNLPPHIGSRLNQPWDDGISSLVALSGEPLSIHGETLRRFKVSQLAQSVLVIPIKVKREVVGLLVVARKTPRPFGPSNQALLQAVADYASISLVNARLFRALEERALSFQSSAEEAQARERRLVESFWKTSQEVGSPLKSAEEIVAALLVGEDSRLNATQKALLRSVQEKLTHASQLLSNLETIGN
jgi:two-component system NtrC family sensor kinase